MLGIFWGQPTEQKTMLDLALPFWALNSKVRK